MKVFRSGRSEAACFSPSLCAKTVKSQLLHSFEVLDPIRFPRFTTVR
jgi:hypothetical protein